MADVLKIGGRVEISGKNVQGVIAYVGNTSFAPGTWVGLILDEPKGKNNGSVQGQEYFKCEEKYGMFVKENQIIAIDENGQPIQVPSNELPSSKSARNRQSFSRMSLISSRRSLTAKAAGNRQSLSASVLVGSSRLTEQAEIKETVKQTPKRKPFLKAGFVEMHSPQITSGQLMSAPNVTLTATSDDKVRIQQELNDKIQKITDLQEKLETLKSKRQHDQVKLKDYDKLKIQSQQLIEFKTKIMNNQVNLQSELQEAKQRARDAIEAKKLHFEDFSDLAEALEMTTLDKEMAEEKAEALQLELEMYKEKLEEATVDLELLKVGMQQKNANIASPKNQLATYEIKQLQKQNARLRETLVKLRDISAHEKHEHQEMYKDIDKHKSEITELGLIKEKLSTQIEKMEQQISDLQEQVDAALGAEEMVVILSDQKLTLEERVEQLQGDVAELEALQDMNNQLVESNAELEADLREELDMALAATREALHSRDAALEILTDREQTINKFQDLIHHLQKRSLELHDRLEAETTRPISGLPEMIDFNKMFSESKAQVKTIDLEIRRIEINQMEQQINLLSSYMPDSFKANGGDHDAILLILLMPRMIKKLDIIMEQINNKFGNTEQIDKSFILKCDSINQYSFKCRITFFKFALQVILDQYCYVLNTCKPEILLKAGSAYLEIAGQEKVLNELIDLLKTDQLDENISTEALEKSIHFFHILFPVLFGLDAKINQVQLLTGYVKCLSSIIESFVVDSNIITSLLNNSKDDISVLIQHITTTTDFVNQQLELIKRSLPLDTKISNLGLSNGVLENLYECYKHALKISKTLLVVVKGAVQVITSRDDSSEYISTDKIEDLVKNLTDKLCEPSDLCLKQSIENSLCFLNTQISQLAQFLHDNEFHDYNAIKEENTPLKIRAETMKKELEQTKTLTTKLENKESYITELKKLLKVKQDEISEMTIRKELAEKKLGNKDTDHELTIKQLERNLEKVHNDFKKREREFQETVDHLKNDIGCLENEKLELSKEISNTHSCSSELSAKMKNSPLQEIDILKKLFHQERDERIKIQNDELNKILDNMVPLPSFKNTPDHVLDRLFKEGLSLNQDLLMHLAKPEIPAIYKLKPGSGPAAWKNHFAEERCKLLSLRVRNEEFQSRVSAEVVKRKFGGKIESDLTIFPTNEMAKALNESKPVDIGYIKISKELLPPNEKPRVINLELEVENLQKIILSLTS